MSTDGTTPYHVLVVDDEESQRTVLGGLPAQARAASEHRRDASTRR